MCLDCRTVIDPFHPIQETLHGREASIDTVSEIDHLDPKNSDVLARGESEGWKHGRGEGKNKESVDELET